MSGTERVRTAGPARGLTLLELMIALALASSLALGLVQIAAAAGAADRLQRNQAQLLDRARFAYRVLARAIRQAGYRPEPWNPGFAIEALGEEIGDEVLAGSDRLALRGWSDRNCFDNRNPDLDALGRPLHYLRENLFEINASGQLARTCRYGPAADALTTQVRRQGLLPGVEAFELLYGADADADGSPDRWLRAAEWADPRRVLGVRIGLLLAADDAVADPAGVVYEVLGDTVPAPADGRLRRAFDFTVAIRGRAR